VDSPGSGTGCGECGDEPPGSGAMQLVNYDTENCLNYAS
jgi:hypothetical protein